MSAREVFSGVMAVGLLVILVIGLAQLNWVAVGWACFGLLGACTGIALARSERRAKP